MSAEVINLSEERDRRKAVALLIKRGGDLSPTADWKTIGVLVEYMWGGGKLTPYEYRQLWAEAVQYL